MMTSVNPRSVDKSARSTVPSSAWVRRFASWSDAAGKLCIEVAPTSKMAWISEELCIGCGICVKVVPSPPAVTVRQKCPFEAIKIINLPKNLERDTTHRYGPNSFKLHRSPLPPSISSAHAVTGSQCPGPAKCSGLSALTALASPPPSRFWRESRNPTSAALTSSPHSSRTLTREVPPRLAGDPDAFPRVRAPKLFHARAGGQPQGHHQAAVR
jgi:ferredoxin